MKVSLEMTTLNQADEALGQSYYESTVVDVKQWPWSSVPAGAKRAWVDAAKSKKWVSGK